MRRTEKYNRDHESSGPLKIEWFDTWSPKLDEALEQLPRMDICSHDLYRRMIRNPGPTPKRTALVSDAGRPVAVVGLRNRGGLYWTPMGHWILPGGVFPVLPGQFAHVLEALGSNVWVACWRWEGPPDVRAIARSVEEAPTHQMPLSGDFVQFWRQSSCYKTVRLMRNRCRNFTFAINQPGALEWTISQWDARWCRQGMARATDLDDRILAARYLQERGRHFTLTLCDDGQPVAGETYVLHGRDLVSLVCHRNLNYEKQGVGVRLMELIFNWAAERGFQMLDLGRTHDYKNRWAPVDGRISVYHVCPEYLYRLYQVRQLTLKAGRCMSGLVRRALPAIMPILAGDDLPITTWL